MKPKKACRIHRPRPALPDPYRQRRAEARRRRGAALELLIGLARHAGAERGAVVAALYLGAGHPLARRRIAAEPMRLDLLLYHGVVHMVVQGRRAAGVDLDLGRQVKSQLGVVLQLAELELGGNGRGEVRRRSNIMNEVCPPLPLGEFRLSIPWRHSPAGKPV